jgi:hypothetical protein
MLGDFVASEIEERNLRNIATYHFIHSTTSNKKPSNRDTGLPATCHEAFTR